MKQHVQQISISNAVRIARSKQQKKRDLVKTITNFLSQKIEEKEQEIDALLTDEARRYIVRS
jgi:phenylpyruvate tautomerase PptA (4-oxalocrotonate tautomerase family)